MISCCKISDFSENLKPAHLYLCYICTDNQSSSTMALLTDINDLLNKRKVESDRIEFKKGWNPTAIYRSICAFANDIEDNGGGYILVGVEAIDGVPVRPVTGLSLTEIDNIQRKMNDYNNMFEPYYMPRPSVEEVDGKHILALNFESESFYMILDDRIEFLNNEEFFNL